MEIGLLINLVAGTGGEMAMKGSDDLSLEKLNKAGIKPVSPQRLRRCLEYFARLAGQHEKQLGDQAFQFVVCNQALANMMDDFNLPYCQLETDQTETGTARDTFEQCKTLQAKGVDLLVFVGGDGTARNVLDSLTSRMPVLGIPAGVKMHSGCFAISPESAAELLLLMVSGQLVSARYAEVRDIDEQLVNKGRVNSQFYGEMLVPDALQYMQNSKVSGVEHEPLVLQEIAEFIVDEMQENTAYFLGPGTCCKAVFDQLDTGFEKTLLGVDCVINHSLYRADCTSSDLLEISGQYPHYIVVSPTGGQGHLFGRGNQQFNAELVGKTSRDNIIIVSPKTKLLELEQRPLLVDFSELQLAKQFTGFYPVVCGYQQHVLYPVSDSYKDIQ